jgi:hypothetical protein
MPSEEGKYRGAVDFDGIYGSVEKMKLDGYSHVPGTVGKKRLQTRS